MVDFSKTLKKKLEDVKRPPLIPVGTYTGRVAKQPEFNESGDGKWKTIDFQLQLVEAGPDVDQEALAEYGGLSKGSIIRHSFMYSTEDTAEANANADRTTFRLKQFLTEHLAIEGVEDLDQAIANSLNQQCMVHVGWRPDKNDPEVQYNMVKKTAPLPT